MVQMYSSPAFGYAHAALAPAMDFESSGSHGTPIKKYQVSCLSLIETQGKQCGLGSVAKGWIKAQLCPC